MLIIFFSRHELLAAWELLGRVNVWILLLIIPAQFLSYYAVGAMILDYLRAKGELVSIKGWQMARIALELNFVNHTLPSGGVSGISYMNWRMKHLGVSTGRATLAQAVRFMASFGAYLVLLLLALLFMAIDGNVSRFTILVSAILGTSIICGTLFVIYIISSESRLQSFSRGLSRTINNFGHKVLRRKKALLREPDVEKIFMDLHADYLEIKRDPKVLKKPIIWAFVYNLAEIAMFMLAFAALGSWVNPAPLLIAYGVAGLAGLLVITPGGAGAYEALMISFLASAGVVQDVAIAGILLARVTLMLGTIISGYIFYQLTVLQYGKNGS